MTIADSPASSHPPELAGARELPLGPGMTCLLWNPVNTRLSPSARDRLRRTLPATAIRVFDGTTEEYWQWWLSDEKLDRLASLIVVVDPAGTPVAWAASDDRDFAGHTCWYASMIGVRPDYEGSSVAHRIGLYLLDAALARAADRELYAVGRTASPKMYAWASTLSGTDGIWPSPDRPTPARIQHIATDAAVYLGQADRFDPHTLIIADCYDNTESGLWRQRPVSGRAHLDEWFQRHLGPRDAFMFIVKPAPETA